MLSDTLIKTVVSYSILRFIFKKFVTEGLNVTIKSDLKS